MSTTEPRNSSWRGSLFLSIINDLVSFLQIRMGRVFEAHRLPNNLRPLRLQRDCGLTNSVTVELVLPKDCREVTATPLEIVGDWVAGALRLCGSPRVLRYYSGASSKRGAPATRPLPRLSRYNRLHDTSLDWHHHR